MPSTVSCLLFLSLLSTSAAFKRLKHVRSFLDSEKQLKIGSEKSQTGTMKALFPWYHTSTELQSELSRLSTKCNGALSVRNVSRGGLDIPVARVRDPKSKPVNKVFVLFGEHSRELISPESGLHFLRVLCGDVSSADDAPLAHLKDNEYEMVLNGNPGSRSKVESGEFCLRVNPHGVDLNRNWDEHFDWNDRTIMEGTAGKRPFSETETQIFKELVSDYKPTTFLTVHSGTRGIYMPYAWGRKAGLGIRNQASMLEVMKNLDAKHCKCPYGAAGKEVGYDSPGTCLDWVYDNLDTPYSFAFEIYTKPADDEELTRRWQEKVSAGALVQLHAGDGHLAMEGVKDIFEKHSSDFVQVQANDQFARSAGKKRAVNCFAQFNPITKEKYDEVLANWANAYLEMSQQIAEKLKKEHRADLRARASI